jgi:A/G-specific adenine glycosylase
LIAQPPGSPKTSPGGLPAAGPSALELPVEELRQRLLAWYDLTHRALPWRRDRDPYRVWLSEVMLQQTRVDVVVPYFERFAARFPTLPQLAAADEAEVLSLWSGLGYYSRGRRLLEAAQAMASRHGGRFPARPDAVRGLPGVGDYTAGAVLSIAFGQREPAVDGNVRRVLGRWAALDEAVRCGPKLRALAARLVPARRPGDFNQALMELGARVCLPRAPRCGECPVRRLCEAARLGRPEDFSGRAPRPRSEAWLHVAALVRDRSGRVLLELRPADEPILAGLWHLPGVFVPEAEAAGAIGRLEAHVRDRLGVGARIGPAAAEGRHQITFRRIRALAYAAELDRPARAAHHWRWTRSPAEDGLASSSLLGKLLRDASRPRQLALPGHDSAAGKDRTSHDAADRGQP